MANLPQPFDASQVDPTQSFDPIPAGKYPMHIVESEMKQTKDGRGQYLQLVCEVLDGEFKGRKIWERLNLINANTTAVEIAHRTLSAICRAVGVMRCTDSVQLHMRPFLGKVKFVPADKQYDAKNEMSGYEQLAGGVPAAQPAASGTPAPASSSAPAAAPPAAASPAPPAGSAPPWHRKAG